MSFNFSNNIYMLGAHFIYVTLSKHPTTWTCFWFLSAVLLDPCYHPTQYPPQCHNAIIHVLWLGVTIIFQLRHHRETTCHSVGDGPHLTVAHPARQDMCQITLYSKTNNTNSCQTSRVDWLRPESRERRVQFALCWHHLSHTNTHSNIQIALGVRVASKCYAGAPPERHVYTVGICVVQLECFEGTINWNGHSTTDWSAASATKGVWVWTGCMNMLLKDHIYVVQGYKSYICPIKFGNIYVFFKNIYMLFKKKMFFKKHNMSDKKICRLKNMFFKKHNMSDKKHIYVG